MTWNNCYLILIAIFISTYVARHVFHCYSETVDFQTLQPHLDQIGKKRQI